MRERKGAPPHKEAAYGEFEYEKGEGVRSKTPVIFAPGLGETAAGSFKEPVKALARLGHDTYALTHKTTAVEKNTLEKEKSETALVWEQKYGEKLPKKNTDELFKNIPIAEFRKAQALIAFIKDEVRRRAPGERVDIIGHSQAGAYALIAAFLEPELFKHVVLVNPAGQSGRESKWPLIAKFHLNLGGEFLKNPSARHFWDTVYTLVIKRMYAQAIREGGELAKFNAYPFLDALGHIAPEVTKKTYFDSEDRIFRAQKIKRTAEVARGKGNTLLGEREETKQGEGHYNLVANPDEYAALFHRYLSEPEETVPERKAA